MKPLSTPRSDKKTELTLSSRKQYEIKEKGHLQSCKESSIQCEMMYYMENNFIKSPEI